MFRKAVHDHSSAKPLHPSNRVLNTNNYTATKQSSPIAGTKRKLDVAHGGQSALGSLHNAVYFDENDFDDDDDLDFEISTPLSRSQNAVQASTETIILSSSSENYPNASNTNANTKLDFSAKDAQNDIKYPELPQLDDMSQEQLPPSSVPIPWSSSPVSHHQPPQQKRRKLPWEQQQTDTNADRYDPITPAATKKTSHKAEMPWNKTASTVKDEQKELRKLNKKRLAAVADTHNYKPQARVASLFLSDEQRAVLEAVVERGKSIFFTGSAGTGKSVLMREIIKKLRDKYRREPDRVAVTASTGLAACNIEGVTLHSFAGIGLGKESAAELVKKVRKNPKARNRWLRTKVLIIDEVSMVDGDLFDKLEEIARRIRNNGRPFGGIQLIVTGDFFQLPPVPDSSNRDVKFAFNAATWNTSIQHTILLTHVFRQKDPVFAEMLNEMRLGKISPRTIEAFKKLSRPLDFHDALDATELFPTRAEVENANGLRMGRLSGEVLTFHAQDSGTIQDIQMRERLLSNCMAPQVIHLKKGAQVMLIKNMEDTLVNGSLGKIVAFMDEATFDYYRNNEDEFTGDGKDGSGDEATSQARKRIRALAHVKDGGISTSRKWPLVCFTQPDGTERHLLCQPETWKIELPNGEVQAQRSQVPLILAWALSIHKAQGQTLPRVKVDLGRVFEKGQAYVALSRATSQAGLQVTGFDPRKVMVHSKVVEFYTNLSNINSVVRRKTSNGAKNATSEGTKVEELDDDFDEQGSEYISGFV
ncbi:ATP-dependent DNA helicase PIF1 [Talaromyces atroroseus]|uniref:ATP-dependent DNA helicase PIF1 n=1 Tax=Talaromyces atroroseus TaxID=1441469 RepID=A0A225ACG2_TALAT|nr:ATP-dependent DNA helicase PIF1 [Talaromyces atroroseus]OKL58060.1 ATP-dependent DNA helicase PIF1 [Talaromyces atroroseus]